MSSESLLELYRSFLNTSGRPKVVLTDLFDTIIGRRVEPEYVKSIWSKRLRYAAGITASSRYIHSLRVEIEAELCKANVSLGYDDEFRHLDLCNEMFSRLERAENLSSRFTAAQFSELCESIELQIEREVQFVYPSAVTLLDQLGSEDIPVYVVSDSFFSTRQMRNILQHHGLDSYLKGFFLSSETLVAKRSGRLFERVLGALPFAPSEALMLGDNPISDISNAAKYGIVSILVQHRIGDESRFGPTTAPARLESGFRALQQSSAEIFPEMALDLYAFTARLFQRASQIGARDLLFCSREGLLLKDLFDRYQEQLGLPGRIRTHYFYTSRLASFLPSLGPLEHEPFERLFRQYRTLSLRTFLLSLQFSDDFIEHVASILDISADQVFSDFPTSSLFAQLRETPAFTDAYESSRQEQRALTLAYISAFFPEGQIPSNLTLVDVGWKGTIQDNLRHVLPSNVTLHGLYVGLVAPGSISPANQKEGLLFSILPSKSEYFDVFFESCALFEILLSAHHPGTLRYTWRDDVVAPVFGNDEKRPEIKALIESLQAAYKQSCDLLYTAWSLNHIDELADLRTVASHHGRMVLRPSRAELGMIASLDHYENFGVFNHTTFWLPERLSRTERLRNLSRFLKNPGSVLSSSLWPALSLARHGLEWIQPWYARRKMKQAFRNASR